MDRRTIRASLLALTFAAAGAGFSQVCDPGWSALGDGLGSNDSWLAALEVFDDGSGAALYAGGTFTVESGAPARGIARWDGASWTSVGGGGTDEYGVTDMIVFDDGSGPALYVVGYFNSIAGVPALRAAKWDGSTWSEVGGGLHGLWPDTLAVFDDGTGSALYAGGWGGNPSLVLRLSEGAWLPAGELNGWANRFGCEYFAIVRDLKVVDDGSGPALYAGGTFFNDTWPVYYSSVARFRDQAWSGVGTDGPSLECVWSMEVFDVGTGPALYAGGYGGADRWDGVHWSKVPGVGYGTIKSILAHDDGSGLALCFGGKFESIGGIAANSIARWDGSVWSPMGTGVLQGGQIGTVKALHAGWSQSPNLFVLGHFTSAGGSPALGVAQWGCVSPCPADCNADNALDLFDFLCFVNLYNTHDPAADCTAEGDFDFFDFVCLINLFNAGC